MAAWLKPARQEGDTPTKILALALASACDVPEQRPLTQPHLHHHHPVVLLTVREPVTFDQISAVQVRPGRAVQLDALWTGPVPVGILVLSCSKNPSEHRLIQPGLTTFCHATQQASQGAGRAPPPPEDPEDRNTFINSK